MPNGGGVAGVQLQAEDLGVGAEDGRDDEGEGEGVGEEEKQEAGVAGCGVGEASGEERKRDVGVHCIVLYCSVPSSRNRGW